MSLKVVIRAGGAGTRLWPLARQYKPKHLIPFLSGRSLLEETYTRIKPMVKPDDVFVSTVADYRKRIAKLLPEIPEENLIIEPERRDTTAVVGLEAAFIHHRDPEATILGLAADHTIGKPEVLRNHFRDIAAMLDKHPDYIFTLGIKPAWVAPNFGHIKIGEPMAKTGCSRFFKVAKFIEKPEPKLAERFTQSGQYLWNANLFCYKAEHILDLYRKLQPDVYRRLMAIEKAIGTSSFAKVLGENFSKIEKIAFDYTIIEKTDKLGVVPADIDWMDIGNWEAYLKNRLNNPRNNLVKGKVITKDCHGSIIFGNKKKVLAAVGLKDMVIVDTPDALLVCPAKRSMEVKDIVKKLEQKGKKRLL